MSLSERIAIGRSTETGCASSHWAIERAARERLGVADLAPVAALHPLGDEGAIGRDLGPVQEAVGQALGVGLQRLLGDDQGRAVVALGQRRLERAAERQLAIADAALAGGGLAHDFCTFAALPARKSRMRDLAAGSP